MLTQYFSTDDPDLYITKIQYIRENDVTDLGVVFAEEEFDKDGRNPQVNVAQSQCCVFVVRYLHWFNERTAGADASVEAVP